MSRLLALLHLRGRRSSEILDANVTGEVSRISGFSCSRTSRAVAPAAAAANACDPRKQRREIVAVEVAKIERVVTHEVAVLAPDPSDLLKVQPASAAARHRLAV
jgi:hypothetical protein